MTIILYDQQNIIGRPFKTLQHFKQAGFDTMANTEPGCNAVPQYE